MVALPFSAARRTRPGRSSPFVRLLRSSGWLADRLLLWRQRVCERALIAGFDERTLRDIGLTRLDVQREYRKPFWRE